MTNDASPALLRSTQRRGPFGAVTLDATCGGAAIAAASVYFATSACTLAAYGLRWPAFDQYRQYVPLLELPFPDNVVEIDNGHRPVLPNLVRYADVAWFGQGQAFIRAVAALLAVLALASLVRTIFRTPSITWSTRGALVLAATLALCWLGSARMLLHGNEMLNVEMTLVALLLGIASVLRAREGAAVGWGLAAGACATAATFTFGPGIATFPTLLLAALVARVPWRAIGALALVFAAVAAIYLLAMRGGDGVREALTIEPGANLRDAMQWLSSPAFFAWLGIGDPVSEAWRSDAIAAQWGGPLLASSARALAAIAPAHGGWWSTTALLGATGLAAAVLLGIGLWRRERRPGPLALTGLALAAFGAATAILIAIARHSLFAAHPDQLHADRYLPWTCLFWLGLVMLVAARAGRRGGIALAVAMLFVALVAGPVHLVQAGWSGVVSDNAVRGALALRLGVWDETAMPTPHDSPRAAVLRAAELLRSVDPGYFGAPLRDGAYAFTAPAESVGAVTSVERFIDPLSGRAIVRLTGRLVSMPPDGSDLVVVDAGGHEMGVASTAIHRRDWRAWVWPVESGFGWTGHAFADDDCRDLALAIREPAGVRIVLPLPPCGD